jgi:BirA family biotin operon repressor/biotin-[acetyl-CoA-carboxylase] ligase
MAGATTTRAAGLSLTFSLALPLNPVAWSGLSLAVGAALADALDPPAGEAPPRIGLKWPNDLWLMDAPGRGRKLGGVLIETVAVGERRMAVIGIGLNVQPQPLTPEMNSGFGCLLELWPDIDAPQALRRVAAPLTRALRQFERAGLAPFAAAYRRRDLLLGQSVQTTYPGVPEGVAEGIDEQGALRVRAGTLHSLVSGEVSVRPAA